MPLATILLVALSQTQMPQPLIRIDAGAPARPSNPQGAMQDGLGFVAWNAENNLGLPVEVWGAVSADTGLSWAAPFRVDQAAGFAERPLADDCVHVAGGQINLCWMDDRNSDTDVYFRRRATGATSFAAELRLDDLGKDVDFVRMVVSEDGSGIAVLMGIGTNALGVSDLILTRSTDFGASFTSPTLVQAGIPGLQEPLLVDDGFTLHVAWTEVYVSAPGFSLSEPRYQRSMNGGQTWLAAPVLLAAGTPVEVLETDLAVDGNRIAFAYAEISAINGVSVIQSDNGGQSWTSPVRVAGSMTPGSAVRLPQLAFTPNHLVVSWADDRTGGRLPYMAWTDDQGTSWTERQLSANFGAEVQLIGQAETGVFGSFWRAGAHLNAVYSHVIDPWPTPQPFPLGPAFGNSFVSEPQISFDSAYGDFLCVAERFTTLSGTTEILAGGFRTAQVEPIVPPQPGLPVSFLAFGFPEVEAGSLAQILVSFSPGPLTLPGDGRLVGLTADPALNLSLTSPGFTAFVTAGGGGATGGQFTLPLTTPPGTTFYIAAVSYRTAPLRFGTITDVRSVTVQ